MKPKGSQFTTLYRGLRGDSIRGADLGHHWSTDRGVAEHFASFDEEGYAVPGHVVEARVHSRHVVTGLERSRMQATHGVHGTGSAEFEKPLRKGAFVHVSGVESLDEDGTSSPWTEDSITSTFGKRKVGRV